MSSFGPVDANHVITTFQGLHRVAPLLEVAALGQGRPPPRQDSIRLETQPQDFLSSFVKCLVIDPAIR